MATLNVPQNGQATKGRNRTRKPVPSVDLTAMVDLAFLLITFFMLTTSLSKFQAVDVAKPVDMEKGDYPASRTVTLLLGKNNQIVWYRGEVEKANPAKTDFRMISTVLKRNQKEIAAMHSNDPKKYMIVIIKPTDRSVYKNFVDALDEMRIANILSYVIDDDKLLGEEDAYLKRLGAI
ncbi:ExbD/TolR family protein [Pedobacter frigoris]|uniref:Biopolymer transporter ExbD n=1 Tax=Pedobacter frigoris TaxID=2571272 RepID=A0A4U1CDV3_9SPHI|nr:biopolymer transporter ExbD [Pedobacter frigoris]TKC05158.1 biopolymer transporter ExbD [Pedobacter frigoris]